MIKKQKRKINKLEFFALLNHIATEKKIDINEIIEIMKSALIKSFESNFDPDAKIEINIDKDKKDFIIINHSKIVVDEPVPQKNRPIEINIKDAQKIDKNVKVGDKISEGVNFSTFSNVIADQIGQIFKQKLTTRHKKMIYEKFSSKAGEIVRAVVVGIFPNYVLFKLVNGGVDAFMPNVKRNHRQPLAVGDEIDVYVEEVKESGRGSQIIVSNGSIEIVRHFLELEIPEIEDGTIEVLAISRIPGYRSKIAVKSNNKNIDPTGSIVGVRGTRINQVSNHLFGEKIDVIHWSANINEFISNAISPGKVIAVIDKDLENPDAGKLVIVPNKQHTLAIGRAGLNARLASHLTNTKIDIISLHDAQEKNIDFEWNGNITPEQLEMIETSERISYSNFRGDNSYNSSRNRNIDDFDSDISQFYEGMTQNVNMRSENTNSSKSKRTTTIKSNEEQNFEEEYDNISFEHDMDNSFSDEDLKRMEREFGFSNIDDYEKKKDK